MNNDCERRLPGRVVSDVVAGPGGEPTYMVETLPVEDGGLVHVQFESAIDNWRHGLFIATHGELRAQGATSRAHTMWTDSSPDEITLDVLSTHGSIVFYNIWDRSRQGGFGSQSYTSAMLREDLDDGWIRYRCQDFSLEPDFTSLVFRIRV